MEGQETEEKVFEPTEVLGAGEVSGRVEGREEVFPGQEELNRSRIGNILEKYTSKDVRGVVSDKHDKLFIPVTIDGGIKVHRFTRREIQVLDNFLKSGSLKVTAESLGIATQTVKRILKRAAVNQLLQEKVHELALAERFGRDAIRAQLIKVALGLAHATREQMEALKECRKMFDELNDGIGPTDIPAGMEIGVVFRRKAEGK